MSTSVFMIGFGAFGLFLAQMLVKDIRKTIKLNRLQKILKELDDERERRSRSDHERPGGGTT